MTRGPKTLQPPSSTGCGSGKKDQPPLQSRRQAKEKTKSPSKHHPKQLLNPPAASIRIFCTKGIKCMLYAYSLMQEQPFLYTAQKVTKKNWNRGQCLNNLDDHYLTMYKKKKILVEEMSWAEVEEAIKAGKNSVLICVGAIEQHGPHCPLNTDTLLGHYIAIEVAKKMGNALVAPAIHVGVSTHFMDYPGTITVKDDTLISLILDYFDSLERAGFRNMFFIRQHGGNRRAMHIAIREIIAYRKDTKARAFYIAPYDYSHVPDTIRKKGFNRLYGPQVGLHANIVETSMVLAVRPDLVNMEVAKATEGYIVDYSQILPGIKVPSTALFEEVRAPHNVPGKRGWRGVNESGAFGNSGEATVELGKEIIDGIVERMAADLKKIAEEM